MTEETRHNVNESADKYRAKTDVTRGNDTRDQENIKLESRGDDPVETVESLDEMIEEAEDTADDLRSIQPDDTAEIEVEWVTGDSLTVVDGEGDEVLRVYIGDDAGLHTDVPDEGSDMVVVRDE